jgi:WhiB family redox-sensing transcriptional regulator
MTAWQTSGACAGLTPQEADRVFFPDTATGPDVWDEARTLCAGCPVRDACLTAAGSHAASHGMWGGLTPEERDTAGIPTGGTRPRPGTVARHGTNARWHSGCRCEPCADAKRAYNRDQMRRWRAGIPADDRVKLPTFEETA